MQSLRSGVRAVIFDLSGTVIDYRSRGPVIAFVELFEKHGVAVTEVEARRPMGLHKRDHVASMLRDPAVATRWSEVHGKEPGESDVEKLYLEFPEIQVRALRQHCEVLPGVAEVTAALRLRMIPFAATTGFDRAMMAEMIPAVQAQGFAPEIFMTPDQVGGVGRPAPWMAFAAARHMNVYPMRTIVKVGDTEADVAEAANAGMWCVAVTDTGNEAELGSEVAGRKFGELGAHYVIDSVADLLPVIDALDERISKGEKP
ncbi:MAG: phosphonoacetaldehyde hydrolase [Bryobacteraceae bacterium]|nr:phosphonoacetaldehyde hydrolase [Bryobacteraceae bacterium]